MGSDSARLEWWKAVKDRGPASPTVRLVLYAMSTWADPDGGSCFPSQSNIAAAASLSLKTVQRAIAKAKRLGWLRSWPVNIAGTTKHSNHYWLTVPDQQEQSRHAAVLFSRDRMGRFLSPNPNNPAVATGTVPLHSGVREPETPPIRRSLQEEPTTPRAESDRLRSKVIELAKTVKEPAAIAGILWRYELSEAQIREWISQ